jgi:hypothetical protein
VVAALVEDQIVQQALLADLVVAVLAAVSVVGVPVVLEILQPHLRLREIVVVLAPVQLVVKLVQEVVEVLGQLVVLDLLTQAAQAEQGLYRQ